MMSLPCHFIDSDWVRRQVVLNAKVMDAPILGNTSVMFLGMLEKWEIKTERAVLVLRDGGANVVKGCVLLTCQTSAAQPTRFT